MDCKQVQKMIPAYIQDDLDLKELNDFMKHVSGCEECMEELSIQYLIAEGLSRLEDGSNFDLQAELEQKLDTAKRRIQLRKAMQIIVNCAEILGFLAIIIIILMVILL